MKNICIIKLGAKGDVVRTLSILPAIKKKYPDSEITWITKSNISDLIEDHPMIDDVIIIEKVNSDEIKFDILYNFDIEEEATSLAQQIHAEKKYGFYSEDSFPCPFNPGAEYYLNTLFDDDIKKNNKKTYQEMMFEAADLPYNKERPILYLSDGDKKYAENFIRKNNINKSKLIGIHMGASSRWPSKVWHKKQIKDFIKKATQKGYEILLFGGPEEVEAQKKLIEELKEENTNIYQNNPNNTDREFASLVNICKKIICSDSFALHVSTALAIPTIGLFFVTPPDEVEDYGIVKKIVSPLLDDFFPEKCDQYSEKLVNSISADDVLDALK